MKHQLTVYTKNDCMYCDMMKSKLDIWGYKYNVVNIQEDAAAKAYILSKGHKVVPQLYYGNNHVNPNINTEEYTQNILEQYIGHLDDVK